jgi:hypothetical protein
LVIEAGGEPPWYSWVPLIAPILQGSQHYDWRFRTVPQKFAAGALHGNVIFKKLLCSQFLNSNLKF